MKIDKNRLISLLLALFLVNGLVFLYYQNTVNKTGDVFVYPFDDTYIHLAIAKNTAFYNNWGVVRDEFCSSSSAPLFTATIAFFMKLFGDNEMLPLYINLFFGNLILFALYVFLKNPLWFLASVLFLCTPVLLCSQILSGMEHTMHIFVILAAFMLFLKLNDSEFRNMRFCVLFLLVISLLCLTRYESMFFILPILFILFVNKQYVLLSLTFVAGFLPVLLFGLWSMDNGGFFFPNSLLAKGGIIIGGGVGWKGENANIIIYYAEKIYKLITTPRYMGPIAIMTIIIIKYFIANRLPININGFTILLKRYAVVFIPLTTLFLHALFSIIDEGLWFYRYEAYLLSLLYLALIILVRENGAGIDRNGIVAFVAIFVIFTVPSVTERMLKTHPVLLQAGKNIHDQQIQMAKFLRAHYNDAMVMANDIGAITYYTNIKLKDLVGLGSSDVLTARRFKRQNISTIILENKPYNLIIIYDSWFGIYSETDYKKYGWTKIGELYIENNVICGGNPVSFYTSDETMIEDMKKNMISFFSGNAPKDITVYVLQ